MANSQPNAVELAKQGNVKAIAFLINRSLHSRGITANVDLKDGCLQVVLEAIQLPEQRILAPFIYRGVTGLKSALIKKLNVFGLEIGQELPGWEQKFEISEPSTSLPSSVVNNSVQQLNTSKDNSSETSKTHSLSQAKSLEKPYLTLEEIISDESSIPKEQVLIECNGENGTIILTNRQVIIRRTGALFSNYKKGEKHISYVNILDFQYKNATFISLGYIYLQLSGFAKEISILEANINEYCVTFLNAKTKDFDEVKKILIQKINPRKYDNVFEGRSGDLILTETGIIIKRSGGLLSGHTSGEKNIPYKNITAVQFKRAGLTVGFIQFTLKGGGEAKRGVYEAVTDENTVTFGDEEKTREFERAKNIIEERILKDQNSKSIPQSNNDLEQLEKLASLRDKGIITQTEFEAKKKQILGL